MSKENESITIDPRINKMMHDQAVKEIRSFSQLMEVAAREYLKKVGVLK